jgi:hypothetical protein
MSLLLPLQGYAFVHSFHLFSRFLGFLSLPHSFDCLLPRVKMKFLNALRALLLSTTVSAAIAVKRQDAAISSAAAAATATITDAAASTVTPAADVELLPFELVQLTESDLDPLNETLTDLFGFDMDLYSANALATEKRSTKCKTFPGDALWPIELIWDLFDILLGGALIKTVPIAAPCYPGKYYVCIIGRHEMYVG